MKKPILPGVVVAALLGTFAVGSGPVGVAFDGSNIWVGSTDGTATKLRASDGKLLGTFQTGALSMGVAFDGVNIWVTNSGFNTISKL